MIFGAALLVQGGATLSEYARVIYAPGTSISTAGNFGGGSLSAIFLAGAAGIVFGILAIRGVYPQILTPAAIIAFGAALLLSSNSVGHLHHLRRALLSAEELSSTSGSQILANEMATGSAGIQALAGLSAAVLGILGLAGSHDVTSTLVALLVSGATLIVTGSSLNATVLSFMRPTHEPMTRSVGRAPGE